MTIGPSGLLGQKRRPGLLHIVQSKGDQLRGTIFLRRRCGWSAIADGLGRTEMSRKIAADVIAPRKQTDDDEDDKADDTDSPPAEATAATGRSTSVFDITAKTTRRPVHTSPHLKIFSSEYVSG